MPGPRGLCLLALLLLGTPAAPRPGLRQDGHWDEPRWNLGTKGSTWTGGIRKKKSKSKSVRIMTDEDVAGPSHPAEETEPEIITRSLSLGELRDLRREFTRQTNESILTWLLRIWDAAANDTILDGSEARQLGSLSRDVVIDQGIGRTQQTLSLWRRLLTSVRDRYLCKEDLQVHQGKWSTMEQGTRCLRELAVLEIISQKTRDFLKAQMMSSAHHRCG
ncbi:hypothetical protein DUI87_17391 [Hirundo rustica rustica]|uniref:Uncharacterized protein n=1 Tax=Hirundo rustica rustica TaxID=333673 RepID=A0A3M0JYL6_HIRRU|nr:hypothetical protein DUI87_17391 [Hirundo rustica rustica]